MVEVNRAMNLTRIVEPAAAAVRHYADSLATLLWVRSQRIQADSLLDIGTGAGFPSVPLAVLRPDWAVTAIEATRKKADFVARTATAMALTNLQVEQAHSQHWRPGRRFAIVVLRAVARFPEALRQAARHVAPDGWLVSYRASGADDVACADALPVAQAEGLRPEEIVPYTLRAGEETLARHLHVFRKIV